MRPTLVVRKSAIQGSGLFTDAAIKARSKLGEFTGERISVREARRRAKGAKRISIVELSSTQAVDGGVGGGPFQFVNHSCEPSTFIRIAYGRIEFYALRDLRPGDEITCDYGDSHHNGKLPCGCGSARCRKFI